jgi:hypothetical protein
MNNQITLITVCSRIDNLEQIYNSIINQNYDNYKWIISFDAKELPVIPIKIKDYNSINSDKVQLVLYKNKKIDVTNYAALNNILDNYIKEDTWIHVVDDDNILYPNYLNTINDIINSNKELKFIYYKQQYKDGIHRFGCRSKDIRERNIDIAQVCLYTSIIEDTRFIQKYTADGIFYKEIFNKIIKNKQQWRSIPEFLCYYNFITQSSKLSNVIEKKRVNLRKKSKIKDDINADI